MRKFLEAKLILIISENGSLISIIFFLEKHNSRLEIIKTIKMKKIKIKIQRILENLTIKNQAHYSQEEWKGIFLLWFLKKECLPKMLIPS